MAQRLPYPGLRAFRREEADLFFGRDEEVDAIVERLIDNRFLGVLGASGSGKSSLVRTGLFEALEGGLSGVGSAWRIVVCTPGGDPIGGLARALAGAEEAADLETRLRRGPRSIIEWCEEGHLGPACSLLILVDQFEELFNYKGAQGAEDAHAFAALLVESAASPRAPIYVVLTMRSDYFGSCGAYPALADAISRSMFLTPRMSREACREAIVCPAAVVGFEIDDDLLALLLNDMERFASFVGGKAGEASRQADQLPLMQYALNRMWQRAAGRGSGAVRLTAAAYREIGGLEGALDAHGDEVVETLGLPETTIERVFRALVRGPSVALAVRDPHRVAEIAAIGGLDVAEVIEVVAAFAGDDCQFLRVERPLGPGSYVDINHESLIRQWRRLSTWLAREAQAAETWRILASGAAEWDQHGRDPDALLGGHQLERRRDWWASQRPTLAWVNRYSLDTGREAAALLAIVAAYLDEGEARQVAEEQRRKLRARLITGVAIFALFATAGAVPLTIYAMQQNKYAEQQKNLAAAQREVAEESRKAIELNTRLLQQQQMLTREAERKSGAAQEAQTRAVRQAAVARQAIERVYDVVGDSIERLEQERQRVGVPAAVIRTTALSLIELLPAKSDSAADFSARGARLALVASEAAANSVGVDFTPADAAKVMQDSARTIRASSGDAEMSAQAALSEARAVELTANSREDFEAAAAAYEQAFALGAVTARSSGGVAGFEAATAIIGLDRRLGRTKRGDEAARWCLDRARKVERGEMFVPAKTCLAAVAARSITVDRNADDRTSPQYKEATALLRELKQDWWDADDKPLESAPEDNLARLRLKITIQRLADLLDGSLDVDEALIEQAQKQLATNPRTEIASDLYAGATEASEDDTKPFDARVPLLTSDHASTGYLLDSLPLLRRRRHLVNEADPGDFPSGEAERRSLDDIKTWIDAQLTALKDTTVRIQVLGELEKRRAPTDHPILYHNGYGDDEEPDRAQVLAALSRREEKRMADVAVVIQKLAERNDLLADLKLAQPAQPAQETGQIDIYLSKADREQVDAVKQRLARFRTLCTEARICGQSAMQVEGELARFSMLRSLDKDVTKQAEPSEPDTPTMGYDLVAYREPPSADGKVRPVRGNRTWQSIEPEGAFLFSSQSNLDKFKANPEYYKPAYHGYAVDWLRIGEQTDGNPRIFCTMGPQLLFFESANGRDAWCETGTHDADVDRRVLAAASATADSTIRIQQPVTGGSAPERGLGRWRYELGPNAHIVVPRGGRVERRSSRTLFIQHADGLISELVLSDGAYRDFSGLKPLGADIPFTQASGASTLTWRVKCASGARVDSSRLLELKASEVCHTETADDR